MSEENKNNEFIFRNWLALNLQKNCVVCKEKQRHKFNVLCDRCNSLAAINGWDLKENAS